MFNLFQMYSGFIPDKMGDFPPIIPLFQIFQINLKVVNNIGALINSKLLKTRFYLEWWNSGITPPYRAHIYFWSLTLIFGNHPLDTMYTNL